MAKGVSPEQVLLINTGDNFDYLSPLISIDAPAIMKMLGASGVEVLALGPFELGVGVEQGKDFLRQIMTRTPINVVAANVPGFLPYVRLRKGPDQLKVLVTSVIDPGLLQHYKIDYSDKLSDPVVALRRVMKAVRHDLAIVVIHASRERMAEILKQIPPVDLVIDGESPGLGDNLSPVKSRLRKDWITRLGITAPLVYNNKRGQTVCFVDLLIAGRHHYKALPPEVRVASKSEVKTDPDIDKLIADYHQARVDFFARRRQEKEKRFMAQHPQNMYLGDRGCQGCHAQIWEKWHVSRHHQALESLRRRNRLKDDACLRCHVTGMNVPDTVGGFTTVAQTPWMAGVQCEACHGAGARHAQNPKLSPMSPVGSSGCRKCHDPENDPDFSFEQRWLRIKH